jgi:hypothetical protein
LRTYVQPTRARDGGGLNDDDDDDYLQRNVDCNAGVCVLDVVPEGGKLVLFESAAVEHEELPMRRERGIKNDVSSEIGRGGGVEGRGGADRVCSREEEKEEDPHGQKGSSLDRHKMKGGVTHVFLFISC